MIGTHRHPLLGTLRTHLYRVPFPVPCACRRAVALTLHRPSLRRGDHDLDPATGQP